MKRRRIALTLFALLALTALGGCDDDGSTTPEPDALADVATDAAPDAPAVDGAELYASTPGATPCQQCHGDTGAGDGPLASSYDPPPTNLQAYDGSRDQVLAAIRLGVGEMPAHPNLTAAQVEALADYVDTLRGQ